MSEECSKPIERYRRVLTIFATSRSRSVLCEWVETINQVAESGTIAKRASLRFKPCAAEEQRAE